MAQSVITPPPVKAYSKMQLRKLLYNPHINAEDEKAMAAALAMAEKRFSAYLNAVMRKNKVPESQYKTAKILPPKLVSILFNEYFYV